jgi:aspartyl-tRNA(Asn)/glutamyl-tRNA(Gln) amidotransferase subunit B
VRPQGQKEFGTRVEIKNVNSFRFVEKAIEFEVARQISLIGGGGKVVQETRLYDADRGVTLSMRSKEEAMDYRYFPDPDLMPVVISHEWVATVRRELPELPAGIRARLIREYGLTRADASLVTASRRSADFFEQSLSKAETAGIARALAAKPLANWIGSGIDLEKTQVGPQHLADLVRLVLAQEISNTGAKQALAVAAESGESIERIVERLGLKQVSDEAALSAVITQILSAAPAQVAEYRAGKEKVFGFFVGQVMKQTQGKANPVLVNELLKRMLSGDNQ